MAKKRVFSGIQPTSVPTVGNLSTMRHWPALAEENDALFCVVDLHSITIARKPEDLREQSARMFSILASLGIDMDKSAVYLQGHVPQHSELAWILGCYTMFGELSRMTQFKDKSAKHAQNINAGLFTYPVLMAADILLYDTDFVPVGADQKQHVEIARDIAERFNRIYGDVLVVPEPVIAKTGANILSLQDPSKKMSKSDENPNATIFLTDEKDAIIKKCKKAVTDSDAQVRYDPENKPGVSNLITLYSVATGKDIPEIEKTFEGQGYGVFKPAVGEAVDAMLAPIRDKSAEILRDRAELERLMKAGADRAKAYAEVVLKRVRNAVGFYGGTDF